MICPCLSKVIILTTVLHTILALDVCKDINTNCQSCDTTKYPIDDGNRQNCMKTCGVCKETNVAYNKPTRQSSTYPNFGGTKTVPSNAVDGNVDQVFGGATSSCSHTLIGSPSWWCVDLQQIHNISSIKLFNREGLQYRLSGFELKISSGGQCDELGFDSSTSCYTNTPPTNQSIYTIESCGGQQPMSAKTVFVGNNGFVVLCEVQIFSDLVQCNTGYYSTSSSTCQPCNTCRNDKCNPDTGVCTDGCKATYYGDKCESPCSDKCTESKCYISDSSSQPQCTAGCVDGYTDSYCQTSCPGNCRSCQQDGSSCIECNQGWYGTNCQQQCSDGCLNKMCTKLDGTCACKATYYGDKCESTCSDTCTGSKCYISDSSSQPLCTVGCVDGYRGSYCQTPCPANCRSCEQDGSSCIECNQDWYGTNCESACPGNCVGGCGKVDGRCNDCIPDTVGPYCNLTCGTGCQPRTDQTTFTCDRNGICTNCIVGRYGNDCDMKCSTGCDGECDRNEGKCTACILGKTGETCDTNCSDNCTVCNQNDTNSCTECKGGRWGSSCNKLCNTNCKSVVGTTVGKCNITSGLCSEGCKTGLYGIDCNKDCSSNCKDGLCHQKSGDCIHGSLPGKAGYNCSTEKIAEAASISPVVSGVIGVLCGIVGTVAVGVSYHFCKKRRQSSQQEAGNEPDYVYSNTDLNPTTSTTDDTLTTGYQYIPTNTRNVDYVNQSFNTEENSRNMYDTLDHTPDTTRHTYTTIDSNKVN